MQIDSDNNEAAPGERVAAGERLLAFELETQWRLVGGERIDERLFDLLDAIARGGTLRYAAEQTGCSYRHAWGLVEHAERQLAQSLVARVKGRGAVLTAAGELLRELRRHTDEQLASVLANAALEASARWQTLLPEEGVGPLRVAASHGYGIGALRELLEKAGVSLELHVYGSELALRRYRDELCDMAGFHLPRGRIGKRIASDLLHDLQGRRDGLAAVETREQGFITRPGEGCESVEALARGRRRFVNRQPGAGSRLIFDALLAEAGIAPARIDGYANEEHTHNAVAALIVSQAADVAFGVRHAADAFRLAFHRVLVEDYYIVWRRDRVPADVQTAIIEQLRSQEYARRLPQPQDCDPLRPGETFSVTDMRRRYGAP